LNALKTTQVAALTTNQVVALSTTGLRALSTSQLISLTTTQVSALSSTELNALTTSAIQALLTTQVAALTTTQLPQLTTTNVSSLTTTQLQSLSTTALVSLTTTQVNSISDTSALTTTQSAALFATPLVLDLTGSGIHTLSQSSGVLFDLTASGQTKSVGWVAPTNGLLVEDLNKDGKINNGSELFGSGTSLSDGTKAVDGFQALSQLDTNHDGVIDSIDAQFADLSVWVDSNSNGVTDAGELKSLTDIGVKSLNLNSIVSSSMDNGNLIGLVSSYTTTDGQTRELADVWLATSSSPLSTAVSNLTSTLNAFIEGQSSVSSTSQSLALGQNKNDAQGSNTGTLVNALSQFDVNGNLVSNSTSLLSAGVLANNVAKLTQTAQNNDSQVLTSTTNKPV
jgi:hypothetical protein